MNNFYQKIIDYLKKHGETEFDIINDEFNFNMNWEEFQKAKINLIEEGKLRRRQIGENVMYSLKSNGLKNIKIWPKIKK